MKEIYCDGAAQPTILISLTNQATDDKLTMRFQKGNKFSKGGTKGNKGGRPSKAELQALITGAELARKRLEKSAGKIMNRYIELATREDPATTRHAVDKILPDKQMESPPVYQIHFLNFADMRPSQPKDITPLASNGKAAGPSLSMPTGGEQTKLAIGGTKTEPPHNLPKPQQVKFHAFSSGNGKRRE
jgi:hypothetical protein